MPVLRSWTVDTGSRHVPLLEGVVVLGQGCWPWTQRDDGVEASFRGRIGRTWLWSMREQERVG